MDQAAFWQIIDAARGAGSCELLARERAVGPAPAVGSIETIAFNVLFDEALDALYTWDLWAVAYIVHGGCSDDAFEYFRSWVISQGQQAFDLAVLLTPLRSGWPSTLTPMTRTSSARILLYAGRGKLTRS